MKWNEWTNKTQWDEIFLKIRIEIIKKRRAKYHANSTHDNAKVLATCEGIPMKSNQRAPSYVAEEVQLRGVRVFLPEASFGLRILSLPASVCLYVYVCPSVRQSLACPRDNSSPV